MLLWMIDAVAVVIFFGDVILDVAAAVAAIVVVVVCEGVPERVVYVLLNRLQFVK